MNALAGEGLQKNFKRMLTVSLLFHLLIFLPLFVVSMKRSTIILYSPVYTVDLVDAPSRTKPKKKASKAKEGPVTGKKDKSVSTKKKEEMEALQKKLATLQKKRQLDEKQAMAELHAKVEALKAKKSKKILDAKVKKIGDKLQEKKETDKLIDDIQKRIAALKASKEKVGKETGKNDTVGNQAQRGLSRKEALLMSPEVKAYLNLLDETVREAWNVPRALLDNRDDLLVQLKIVIEEDGGVSSIIVERPSQNRLFDESVLRAINKAAPLPVPPEFLREGKDYYEVGFRFHYFPEN